MPVELCVHAEYPDDADPVFARARSLTDMVRASWPLTFYKGLPRADMEEGRTYVTDIKVLGMFPVPGYRIEIERLDSDARIMQSREGNGQVRTWEHELTVEPQESGSRWTDRVIIDAGMRTAIVARFARMMYVRRHKRRHASRIGAEIRKV